MCATRGSEGKSEEARQAGYVVVVVVVEENRSDESRSHKELAIHTACSTDTTRCRT